MVPQEACRFCNILKGEYKYADIDAPFATTEDFIAIASIGALVEGWSLIVPKRHQLSMRSCYSNPLFVDFIDRILPSLVNRYGSIIAFEHGANVEGSITSCGTDHAHIHLVPFEESLLPDLLSSGLTWMRCHSSEIESKTGANEYLFYTELGQRGRWEDTMGYLHIMDHPISQFFRRLIASRTVGDNLFDYKLNPNIAVSKRTRKMLADSIA